MHKFDPNSFLPGPGIVVLPILHDDKECCRKPEKYCSNDRKNKDNYGTIK